MPSFPFILFIAYISIGFFGAACFFLGDLVAVISIFSVGSLIIIWYAIEYGLPLILTLWLAIESRWHLLPCVFLGSPLIALGVYVSPVVSSGSPDLAIPVPWLSVHAKAAEKVYPLIVERGTLWLAIYGVGVLLAILSRQIWPLEVEAMQSQSVRKRAINRTYRP